MKFTNLTSSVFALAALIATPNLGAEEHHHHDHDHDHHDHAHPDTVDLEAPNGGRLLTKITPTAEFFVQKDRTIQITYLDEKGEPTRADHKLSMIAGNRRNPTTFTLTKTEHGFQTEEALPDGNMVPVVLSFTTSAGEKTNIRFNVNLADCPTCDYQEYACTCAH